MNKQKRMIYIYEENVDYYDSIENKSELINRLLFQEKRKFEKQVEDPRIVDIRRQLKELEDRK